MLLRASGERDNTAYDLNAVTDASHDSGVASATWMRQLTELAISSDWARLPATLAAASEEMGRQQAVDVLVVASAFNGITRVADATGIPLDVNTSASTGEMRASVGLDAFDYSQKTARFG